MLLWYFDCIEHRRIFRGHGCAFPASATDFHEPVFGEDGTLPDPTGFSTEHPDDGAVYNQIKDLLKKDVVAVCRPRLSSGAPPPASRKGFPDM
jgi:hypothetical protein